MVKSALQGDFSSAKAGHERVLESSIAIFADGSPGGIKTMLNEKQLCGTAVRPLVASKRTSRSEFKKIGPYCRLKTAYSLLNTQYYENESQFRCKRKQHEQFRQGH